MCPQPHDGSAEEGLSCSILRLIDDPERLECLRHLLRGFNHRCRNSLNGIKMSLYLSKRECKGPTHPGWVELEQTYQEIERLFDRLQAIYRPLTVTMVRSPLGQLIDEKLPSWRSRFTAMGRFLEVDAPCPEVAGDFDPMHLGLGLDAFVAWRADKGSTSGNPRLSWRIDADSFEIAWTEGHSRKRVISENPASRPVSPSDMANASSVVDCLALPLLARIVAAHGGHQETTRDPTFGLKIRWPQFRVQESSKT
jgi:hypothetical protein